MDLSVLLNNQSNRIVFASNHVSKLDPPVIFSALTIASLVHISPVKFMTWHKYYFSYFKPLLFSTGCFPTHNAPHSGVDGAIHYAKKSYRIFIFPEGKRNPERENPKVYPGISLTLKGIPNARLFLVQIVYAKRKTYFKRPQISVKIAEADTKLDRENPKSIMDAIYEL
ncbi:MAG: 1-acyl-sn-glycerol-3-phosphate acyltransferase [bacterium]|nr:1-acyl-sn-glycerol-3-phosphate acyltransferase [bacterium]